MIQAILRHSNVNLNSGTTSTTMDDVIAAMGKFEAEWLLTILGTQWVSESTLGRNPQVYKLAT